MAYITSFHNLSTVEFEFSSTHANAAAVGSTIFTADAHLHSAYPNHDYFNRDTWERHLIALHLQDGSGNATLNAFKARVFISLDAKVWFLWKEMVEPDLDLIDTPFAFIKVVRDNTTSGTVKTVIRSQLTHTA